MREIKFRAWDKLRKQMEFQFEKKVIAEDGTEFSMLAFRFTGAEDWSDPIVTLKKALLHPDRYKVMQFTGLHDKNGKEIYEGDILTCEGGYDVPEGNSGDCENTVVVEWRQGHTLAWVVRCLCHDDESMLGEYDLREVIGNIYENPELLNS